MFFVEVLACLCILAIKSIPPWFNLRNNGVAVKANIIFLFETNVHKPPYMCRFLF